MIRVLFSKYFQLSINFTLVRQPIFMKLLLLALAHLSIFNLAFTQPSNDQEKYDTVFHDNGLPAKVTFGSEESGEYYEVHTFEYHSNDSLAHATVKTPTLYFEFRYNNRGELIEMLTQENGSTLEHLFLEYTYTATSKIGLMIVNNENGDVQLYNQHTYNEEDELQKIVTLDADEKLISITVMRYHSQFEAPERFHFDETGKLYLANAYIQVDEGENLIPVKARFELNAKGRIYAIRMNYEPQYGKIKGKPMTDQIYGFALKPLYTLKGDLKKIYLTGHSYHGPKYLHPVKDKNHPMLHFYYGCQELADAIAKEYGGKN